MKLGKIFMFVAMAMVGLCTTSCDDDDDWAPGNQPGQYKDSGVGFDETDNFIIGMDTKTITISISRANGQGELTVPLISSGTSKYLKVPESVTFANGATEAEVSIEVDPEMTAFTELPLAISIPEAYTNPYAEGAVSNLKIFCTVLKEDYKLAYKTTFTSEFMEDKWEQDVEYSEMRGIYRMPNLYGDLTVYFIYSKDENGNVNFDFCDETGKADKEFSAYTHSKYGLVTASYPNSKAEDLTIEGNTVTALLSFDVSAGNFGEFYESFTLPE